MAWLFLDFKSSCSNKALSRFDNIVYGEGHPCEQEGSKAEHEDLHCPREIHPVVSCNDAKKVVGWIRVASIHPREESIEADRV